jgi:hypothetical protein
VKGINLLVQNIKRIPISHNVMKILFIRVYRNS